MNFDDYFEISFNFTDNPYCIIIILKNELEYEIMKLWKKLRENYYLTDDKILIKDNLIYRVEFENKQSDDSVFCANFYRNIGSFCNLLMKMSDDLKKEIIEKERILKRKLV